MAQSEYDRLAQGLPHDDYLAQVGRYQAMRGVVDLVDTLIAKADEQHGRESNAEQHARDHRNATFYASPYR